MFPDLKPAFVVGTREGPVRDVMRFHLVYSGPLSASGNKSKLDEAAHIRRVLSAQMAQLWAKHHSLQVLLVEGATRGESGSVVMRQRGRLLNPREIAQTRGMSQVGYVDMIPMLEVASHRFLPLVRESLHLNCELDILFLRQQDPGALVSQGGDIDNRIKTLLDGLRMPSADEEARAPSTLDDEVTYCLMESDTLVSRLNIDTDRLLFAETEKPNEVHLIIEVTLNVLRVAPYNQCLL